MTRVSRKWWISGTDSDDSESEKIEWSISSNISLFQDKLQFAVDKAKLDELYAT